MSTLTQAHSHALRLLDDARERLASELQELTEQAMEDPLRKAADLARALGCHLEIRPLPGGFVAVACNRRGDIATGNVATGPGASVSSLEPSLAREAECRARDLRKAGHADDASLLEELADKVA